MRSFYTILAIVCTWAFASAQISSDSFEGSSIFTITNGGYKSGTSGATDGPASSSFSTVGTQGYGCNNATVTLVSPVYDVSCYTGISVSFRLASFSLGSASNGADGTDKVQVLISTNGGTSFTQYLEVDGNTNAYWGYASGTGTATTAYPGTNTVTPAGGGARTTDGYSTLSITSLPSSANLVVKIIMTNNSANELWVIDDYKLQGTFTSCVSITTGTVSSNNFTWSCGSTATGTVAFTSSGTFASGNVYTAQLSNSSGSFASPTNIGTFTSTANSGTISFSIPAITASGTGYQIQIVSSNPVVTGSASTSFTIAAPNCCPILTGAVMDGCNAGSSTPCAEGQTEIMFFNSQTYSISVSSLSTHVINYYGSSASLSSSTINAYIGSFSANASTTSSLNALTGCSGVFIDAATAGTIPAYSTFIMLPYDFCPTNYDLSNICASFNPIYVLYYGTSTAGNADGLWTTSGNLGNYNSGSNPKYVTADFSSACAGCAKQYYDYDAGQEKNGDGAGATWPSTVSTSSATPTDPTSYTSTGCALPLVLPIDLVSFKAVRYGVSEAEVSFTTLKQEQVKEFILSRSYNGFIYEDIGFFSASNSTGRSDYASYDQIANDQAAIIYYRLQEVDINGVKKTISNCALEIKSAGPLLIYNSGSAVEVKTAEGIQQIELYDVKGERIVIIPGDHDRLNYTLSLENLNKGFYVVMVTESNGRVTCKKIVN